MPLIKENYPIQNIFQSNISELIQGRVHNFDFYCHVFGDLYNVNYIEWVKPFWTYMPEKSPTVNSRFIINRNIAPKDESDLLVAGSVSVMNRICYDAMSRKKTRLEALAASRERDLGSDSDSDQEETKVLNLLSKHI